MDIKMLAAAHPRPTLDLLPLQALAKAAACLKTMAHPARLRMVEILTQGDFTVGQIAELCELPQHQACGHLRLMQGCGLLTSERRGQTVHYRIASPQLPALLECVRRNCGTAKIPRRPAARRSQA
jgi:DNA-binding transcriptional ArsR family regulator